MPLNTKVFDSYRSYKIDKNSSKSKYLITTFNHYLLICENNVPAISKADKIMY